METLSGTIIEEEEASVAEKPQDALIILQAMIENDRQRREEERKQSEVAERQRREEERERLEEERQRRDEEATRQQEQFLQIMKAFTVKQTQQEERWQIDEERRVKADKEKRRINQERRHREEEERTIWNAEAEKERQIMFLKSIQDGGSNLGSEMSAKVVRNTVTEPTMQKLSESDDIENYLATFERVATAFKWPTEIWSLKLAPVRT